MQRRTFILAALPFALFAQQSGQRTNVRGRLLQGPAIRTADGKRITLEADAPSLAVLEDERVAKEEFIAVGEYAAPERFRLDPIHKKAMFVVRDGKPLVITYWCEVCAIRTYSPGKCQCCQEDTELDPRDPALENTGVA
jgi:hypothetical protein